MSTPSCAACRSTGSIDGQPCPFCAAPAEEARTAFWWRWAWVRLSRRARDSGSPAARIDAVRDRVERAIARHRRAVHLRTEGGAA